jgi:hypothetical protein
MNKQKKQRELIQEFLSIFEPGKDFGIREFKRLRMHPMPVMIFAEEIYKISPNQKGIICMLMKKIKESLKNRYIKAVDEKYRILLTTVNCSNWNKTNL